MFLHLGNDIYINQKDIIAVCNLDTASVSKNTQLYLKKAEEAGLVETICNDIPKSFVIVRQKYNRNMKRYNKSTSRKRLNNKDKIYLTNISSVTLLKRSESDVDNCFEL